MNGQTGSFIRGGTFTFTADSEISADLVTAEQIYDTYEKYILDDRKLPLDVRTQILPFLTMDESGMTIPISPSNTDYYNGIIRGFMSILMCQPEYVLLHGWNAPAVPDNTA